MPVALINKVNGKQLSATLKVLKRALSHHLGYPFVTMVHREPAKPQIVFAQSKTNFRRRAKIVFTN